MILGKLKQSKRMDIYYCQGLERQNFLKIIKIDLVIAISILVVNIAIFIIH